MTLFLRVETLSTMEPPRTSIIILELEGISGSTEYRVVFRFMTAIC